MIFIDKKSIVLKKKNLQDWQYLAIFIKDNFKYYLYVMQDMEFTKLSYRQGVQAYIINDNDELLLVCNVGDESFWKVPSGGKNANESSEETLHREVMEELGVTVTILKKCSFRNKFDWPEELIKRSGSKYLGQEQDIFIVRLKDNQNIRIDPKEVKDYKWVKFDKINEVLRLEHQQETVRRVLKEY